jgi:hypothetical protein
VSVDEGTLLARLAESGIPAEVLPVGDGARVVVSSRGGRVYGPFLDGGDAANWIPDAARDPDAWAALLARGDWNVGGDRVWIGPEIAFMIPDRDDYWGSYAMPPSLDPGVHDLRRDGDAVVMTRTAELASFVAPRGRTRVELGLRVEPAPDPLRHLRRPLGWPDVRYAGYTVTTTLAQDADAAIAAEAWTLDQVRAGGTALVGTTCDPQVSDYYEPVGDHLREVPGGVALRITGADRWKVGVSAASATGRVGYLRRAADGDPAGTSTLVVRASASDPSDEHAEEPDHAPGRRGDSIHLYDDDGGLGGFAELEARGRPHVAGSSPAPVTDVFRTWWYSGPDAQVDAVCRALVGIDPTEAGVPAAGS